MFSERKFIIQGIFISVGLILLIRLFILQMVDDSYLLSANNNVLREIVVYPARGVIYDRNDRVIVQNEPVYDLLIIPHQVKEFDTLAFCELLGISKLQCKLKIKKARIFSPYKSSIYEKQLSVRTFAAFQERLFEFPGFFVQNRTVRKYPIPIAAHILGYVGEVNDRLIKKSNNFYRQGDYIGISGIEQSYENYLRGTRGIKNIMVDVFNREQGSFSNGEYDTLAIPGKKVISSMDAALQAYGEALLNNKTGSIVAIEPSTGEILLAASSPSYDPNLLVGRERSKNYYALLNDPLLPLFNRALMAYYPPGSTFKVINDLIGLQEGVLTPEKRYFCDGGYHMGNKTVRCEHAEGSIDMIQAIEHSCNTYHCHVFKSIIDNPAKYKNTEEAYQAWRNHVLKFGVGIKINSDLHQELKGFVPTVDYYNKYFGKGHWKSSTVISLAIGQGELGITPLQMANIMCIIANRGYFYTPHIIKKIGDTSFTETKFNEKNYTDINVKHFEPVIEGMQGVLDKGTAFWARIPGINVCGKTGTAQNPHGKSHSIFVAFAPRENPKIAIACLVENGGYGSIWAAPIASLIIEKYLTDTVIRKDLEKRMLEGIVKAPIFIPKKKIEEKPKADNINTKKK